MELNKLETQILLDIYEADINYKEKIKQSNYELIEADINEQKQEFAAYLLKLKRLRFINFDENKAFSTGGWRSQKYRTNVVIVWTEQIHILEKGIETAEKINKTVLDKVKEEFKSVGAKVYEEIKDWGTKSIAEYFYKLTNGSNTKSS